MCALYMKPVEENKTFNPNICYVCKKEDNGNFITCDQCQMISYCSFDHKIMDNKHKDICAALYKILKKYPHFWFTYNLDLGQWIQTRKEFIRLIKRELPRVLKPREVQMITLAKSCIICHQQVNIKSCVRCFSVNYCPSHKNDMENHYISNCRYLQHCHDINKFLSEYKRPLMRFGEFPNEHKPFVDMITFINQFVSRKKNIYTTTDNIFDWHPKDNFYTEYASGPLTLHYGIQYIKEFNSLKQDCYHFVIHVLGANSVDKHHVPAWELLLHLFNNIEHLEIILIGFEMRSRSENIQLCAKKCTPLLRNLTFESYGMLYHNYVDSELYKKPNIIIGFQADLSDWEELSQTIFKVQSQKCPFLLTAKSKVKDEQNINNILETLDSPLCTFPKVVYRHENKFSSRRPYRDFENDGVSYRNKYLTVFQNL